MLRNVSKNARPHTCWWEIDIALLSYYLYVRHRVAQSFYMTRFFFQAASAAKCIWFGGKTRERCNCSKWAVLLCTTGSMPATHLSIAVAVHMSWTDHGHVFHKRGFVPCKQSGGKGRLICCLTNDDMQFSREYPFNIICAELLIYLPVICEISALLLFQCFRSSKFSHMKPHVYECCRFPTTCPRLCANDRVIHWCCRLPTLPRLWRAVNCMPGCSWSSGPTKCDR